MGFRFFHTLLWIGGLFFGVVPFLWRHEFREGADAISWGDHLGSGVLVFLGLAAMGSFLWGILARFINVDVHGRRQLKRWFWLAVGVQSLISFLGIQGVLTGYSYYFTGAVACVVLAWFVYLGYGVSSEMWPQVKSFGQWLVRRNQWNGIFYGVIFLILLWHNYLMVFDIKPLSWGFHTSLMINRIFNQMAIVGTLYLVIQFSVVAAPKWSRLLVWMVSSLIPIAIFTDSFLVGMWNTNLVDFLNGFGMEGIKNIETELKGGGVPVSILTLILSAVGGIVVLGGVVYLMYWLSKKLKLVVTPLTMVVLVVVSILGATLEQNIGKTWKQRKHVIAEENEFDIQLGFTSKLEPLAGFDVKFRDHGVDPELMTREVAKKPNVFILFIESFRDDSLTEEVTPYLYQFKMNEAQPIERSWASSNGTHLSWFGTFTGRVPIHWEDDRDRCTKEGWPALNIFNEWKGAGYELQIYAPGELAYRNMGNHFFGEQGRVFSLIRDNVETDPIFGKDLSERERLLLESFKSDISSRVAAETLGSDGGLMSIFCIDSPHFYYQWHKDFDPPFKPYFEGTYLPSRPDAEKLQLVKNKYYNALAWSDTLVENFCEHLKKEGIYDDSIIVIMGDHGEEMQDNGGWLHVSSLEDEQIRVPMLVKWPKGSLAENNGRGPAIADASQLDLLPSLLEFVYDTEVNSLAGVSLLRDEPRSAIATTAQSGKMKEAMMFAKDGYKAYFKWPSYWNGLPTGRIYLSRITGPEGDIDADDPAAYEKIINEHFADAIERTFSSFSLASKPEELDEDN